jgi:hypothetical protein
MMGTEAEENATGDESSCELPSPYVRRVPGVLALAAGFAALFVQPLFFALTGVLLAVISLLLSPPGCRLLGTLGLLAAITGGMLGAGLLR